jgi:hypothetical protein
MHFELHRIHSQELIREADEYRLSRQVRKAKPTSRATTSCTSQPTPRRLLAWLRG